MTATILRGDARRLPLADASVDLVVTSPPYWALRSYTDDGQHYHGQIGAEPTPAAYIDSLIECTAEWMRVLKPGGSIWANLGDKYAQATERSRNGNSGHLVGTNPLRSGPVYSGRKDNGVPQKSLMLLPERYRIACVDRLGLIARAVVIWSKPNGLPESVTDRVRRSHEDWVHLVKQPRYFAAVDAIREAHVRLWGGSPQGGHTYAAMRAPGEKDSNLVECTPSPLGKLPGSVREVATQPLKVPAELGIDHFAAFPMDWPRWIITGWSPSGICTACGEGRRPVTTTEPDDRTPYRTAGVGSRPQGGARFAKVLRADGTGGDLASKRKTITGEACACPDASAPTRPAVVVDPFGGTGTTALVAHALGRLGLSVDMSRDYCRLARWRTTDPGQLAAAMQVEKPPVVHSGQLDLFAVGGGA